MTKTLQLTYRFICIVLGTVFLAAGIIKGLDLSRFAVQIGQYGIFPGDIRLLTGVAWLMVDVEMLLGAALLVNWHPRTCLRITAGLLALFIGALAWAMFQGNISDCGCFGPAARRGPVQALFEDGLMLAAALAAWQLRTASTHIRHPAKGWAVATAGILSMILPLTTGVMDSDLKVVDRPESIQLQSLDGQPIAFSGENFLLVLMSTECGHCREVVPLLNDITAEMGERIPVYAVAANPKPDIDRFVEENCTFYPVLAVEEKSLIALMGDEPLPQYLFIHNGQVADRWFAMPPEVQALIDLSGIGQHS
ncbi:TlpA family protein disulfide reductase [Desulfosarcina ovata]|uniref:Thioredoxin domain-containing protein n=1 Tax=Desulfosarcina ovata subsp. ovata TaxID=2752305 RepID=A0A5K8AK31_9BACT|nr:MauE/DoxX family redox-associated membrane protein [Desulfosarcina ovata]BBO92859.1 hypothetical protein DSCOOX_60390 [Desulfosarcina ovata subsp. ovata]